MMANSLKFRAFTRNALDGPLNAMRRLVVRNAAERTLSYMDNHTLRDVGLTRFEIINAIR